MNRKIIHPDVATHFAFHMLWIMFSGGCSGKALIRTADTI